MRIYSRESSMDNGKISAVLTQEEIRMLLGKPEPFLHDAGERPEREEPGRPDGVCVRNMKGGGANGAAGTSGLSAR